MLARSWMRYRSKATPRFDLALHECGVPGGHLYARFAVARAPNLAIGRVLRSFDGDLSERVSLI